MYIYHVILGYNSVVLSPDLPLDGIGWYQVVKMESLNPLKRLRWDETMPDESEGPMWSPTMFTQGFQQAGEEALSRQQEFVRQLFGADAGSSVPSQLGAMSQMAMFKTRVQSGGRISIPDAEREALDIDEGDIVQTVVIPIKRNREDTNE